MGFLRRSTCVLSCVVLVGAGLTAQLPQLIGDLRAGPASSAPAELVAIAGTTFFRANTDATGFELWSSDGTPTGTALVADTRPGAESGFPASLTAAVDRLYFTAFSAATGTELWCSDGTAGGTRLVVDLLPGAASSQPQGLVARQRTLFFAATTADKGRELWISDGSPTGTVLVKDIAFGTASSDPRSLTVLDHRVLFIATTPGLGEALWVSDGTEAGTRRIDPGSTLVNARDLIAVGDVVVFRATVAGLGEEVWESDGTDAGTRPIRDVRVGSAGSAPRNLTRVGAQLFFSASDGGVGPDLWRRAAGGSVVKVAELTPNPVAPFGEFAGSDSLLFFVMDVPGSGRELWRSDGTASGTAMVEEIRALGLGSDPVELHAIGSRRVVFAANDGQIGREVWVSDGSAEGTFALGDLRPGLGASAPSGFVASYGTVLFAANDGALGSELYGVQLGALAQSVGRGCGTASREPRLTSTDPVLGATMRLDGTRAFRDAAGVVLISLPAARPIPFVDCSLYLDLSFGVFALTNFAANGSDWTVTVPVPRLPAGLGAMIQAASFPTDSVTQFDFTNGVHLTIGA